MKLLMLVFLTLVVTLVVVDATTYYVGREGGSYRPAYEGGGWYRPAREGGWYTAGSSEEYGK